MLALWFGFSRRVDRASYVCSGVGLMALKYAIDSAIALTLTGHLWPPLQYLSPIYAVRMAGFQHLGTATLLTLGVVTLPFFWIGVGMSVRRAADAGLPPVVGLGFAVPGLNWLTMIALSLWPSSSMPNWTAMPPGFTAPNLKGALAGAAVAVALGLASTWATTRFASSYGLMLFFVTPLLMGVSIGWFVNLRTPRPLSDAVLTTLLSVALTGGALALFALEGVICLLMAAPIAIATALTGAVVGRAIAMHGRQLAAPLIVAAAAVPLLGMAERRFEAPSLHEVVSVQDIDAPPDVVWRHVIAFSEMAPPTEWVFRTGIAYPIRARLIGEGLGAVRHCEFSTGAFVEPITAWEPGRRLAFDVIAQPAPMQEWGLLGTIHPPHLDTLLRSRRGEFLLVPRPDGGTRLEGRTWYELRASPVGYWALWSDALIHRIHRRVLTHIARNSERAP